MDWKVFILVLTVLYYIGIILLAVILNFLEEGIENIKKNEDQELVIIGFVGKYVYEVIICFVVVILVLFPKVNINFILILIIYFYLFIIGFNQ